MADEDIGMDSPRKKVAYDPDQDPEEKRVLRQKYRVLLKDEEGTKGVLSSGLPIVIHSDGRGRITDPRAHFCFDSFFQVTN